MNTITTLFEEWTSADTLPTEEKLLKNAVLEGKAAIAAETGLTRSVCALSEDAVNTGQILFIRTPFWSPELFYNRSRLGALKAVGYLAFGEAEDAGTLFYENCIEDAVTLTDKLWEKHCRFNENYSGVVTMDGEARLALQDFFPDVFLSDRLLKYAAKLERKLKADVKAFEAGYKNDPAAYRKSIASSHLKGLSDEEYLARFSADSKMLAESYKMLKTHIKEIILLPKLFGCCNYLLRGGTYRDIKGVCRLVSVEEVEKNGWSLNPEDYV